MDHHSRKKKSKKSEKSKRKSSAVKLKTTSDEEFVDIAEEVYPMEHFVSDPQEMINQVFSVMEKEKLHTMIPPILKGMMLHELKERCLLELNKMSIQDVVQVLRGQPIIPSESEAAAPCTSKSSDNDFEIKDKKKEHHQHQTLLDVLEEEMERIAYKTLQLHKKGKSTTEPEQFRADAASPVSSVDVKVISPSNSSVELVCLDDSSEEEEEEKEVVATNLQDCCVPSEIPLIDVTEECEDKSDAHLAVTVNVSQNSDNGVTHIDGPSCESDICVTEVISNDIEIDTALTENTNGIPSSVLKSSQPDEAHNVASPISQNLPEDISIPSAPAESIMIQVFSGKSSTSERLVTKVLRPFELKHREKDKKGVPENEKEVIPPVGSTDISSNSSLFQSDRINLANNASSSIVKPGISSVSVQTLLEPNIKPGGIESLETNETVKRLEKIDNSPVENMIIDQTSCEGDVTAAAITQDCELGSNLVTLTEIQEKEEGEITEDESEDDVELVEVVRDTRRSPTVFLSSDDNREMSDEKSSDKGFKRHKHHRHRHRKHKRDDSPERSKRQIEKRGNRSYRRKKRPVVEPKATVGENNEEVNENLKHSGAQPVPSTSDADSLLAAADKTDTEPTATKEKDKKEKDENVQTDPPKCSSSDSEDSAFNASDSPVEEATMSDDSIDPSSVKSSWADRWAQKKDLKKVVITSKIYTSVRKKILSEKQKRKKEKEETSAQEAAPPPVPPLVLHVEGSVKEYQMLQWMSSGPLPNQDATREKAGDEENIPLPSSENADSLYNSPKTDKIEDNVNTSLDVVNNCKVNCPSLGQDPTDSVIVEPVQSEAAVVDIVSTTPA